MTVEGREAEKWMKKMAIGLRQTMSDDKDPWSSIRSSAVGNDERGRRASDDLTSLVLVAVPVASGRSRA